MAPTTPSSLGAISLCTLSHHRFIERIIIFRLQIHLNNVSIIGQYSFSVNQTGALVGHPKERFSVTSSRFKTFSLPNKGIIA